MRYYTLADIVMGIYTGEVEDRDVFISSGGDKIAYVNGSLHYITSNGYITSLVAVTSDVMEQIYTRIT